MKTENTARIESAIANRCDKPFAAVHASEVGLSESMHLAWGDVNDGDVTVKAFRDVFVARYVKQGYCERYIKTLLTNEGFRLRAEREDKGTPRKAGKTALDKAIESFNALSASERKAFVKFLASK